VQIIVKKLKLVQPEPKRAAP